MLPTILIVGLLMTIVQTVPLFSEILDLFEKPILDLLIPVSNDNPLPIFQTPQKYPCTKLKREPQNVCHIAEVQGPMHTNKYYHNFVMGFQNQTVFPPLYGIRWDDGIAVDKPGTPNLNSTKIPNQKVHFLESTL